MTFDISLLNGLTQEQIVTLVTQQYLFPLILLSWLVTIVIFLLVGMIFVVASRKKYLMIWSISTLITGVFITSIYFLPNVFDKFINLFI